MDNIKVSFVMCGFNSALKIKNSVAAIARQKGGFNYEFIFVDNASTDNTENAVKNVWEENLNKFRLSCFREETPGLIHARKRGIKEALGEIIIFVDDDNVLADDYAIVAIEIFSRNPNVGIAGGCGKLATQHQVPDWWEEFQTYYACGQQAKQEGVLPLSSHVYGAGMAVRRKLVNIVLNPQIRTFLTGRCGNIMLSGEDVEICKIIQILGYEIYYSSKLLFLHEIPQTRLRLDYLLSLQVGNGRSIVIINSYTNKNHIQTFCEYFAKLLYHLLKVVFNFKSNVSVIRFNIARLNLIGVFKEIVNPTISRKMIYAQRANIVEFTN